MRKSIIYIGIILVVITNVSCEKPYKKTNTGLQYLFYESNTGNKPKEGDLIYCNIIYKTVNDDIDSIFHSEVQGNSGVEYQLPKPTCMGCIEEGLMMMSEGDSATFIASADSFFLKTNGNPMPSYFKPGDFIKLEVKMFRIITQEHIKTQAEAQKTHEAEALAKYLKKKNITVQPFISGLYFWKDDRGGNDCPVTAVDGDKVQIRYVTKLLDEKVYEKHSGLSTLDQEGYSIEAILSFEIGQNLVIPGLEEGIKKMRYGSEAYFIIPSKLAYGKDGGSTNLIMPNKLNYVSSSWGGLVQPKDVPPSTTLLVHVELHEIIDKNTNQIKYCD